MIEIQKISYVFFMIDISKIYNFGFFKHVKTVIKYL